MDLYEKIKNYTPYNEQEESDREVMLEFIENNKDVLTRNNRIGHFTTSAWIVNKDKTKVLMIYHNIYKSWAWIGGHADGIEDLFQVVKREIEEETGVKNIKPLHGDDIYSLEIVHVASHIKRGKFVSSHLHMDLEYLFEADEDEELRIKEDENSGVKWIPIDEIDKYVTEEHMMPTYNKLNEKLKI